MRSSSRAGVSLRAILVGAVVAGSGLVAGCRDAREVAGPEPQAGAPVAAMGSTPGVVAGDDWSGYRSRADLKAAGKFWWWATGEDVYQNLDVVPDAVFGQVVRVKFQGGQDYHHAPIMTETLSKPLDKAWFRWRVRFSPGFTTAANSPAGWANSYKLVFWHWRGYEGRGGLEFSNTDQYIPQWYVNTQSGSKINYSESVTPGSAPSFGHVSGEWANGEWYEYVMYYERTGATTARQHWWRRKLTNGGRVGSGNPWSYFGLAYSGNTTPQLSDVWLGGNRNKDIPADMYLYWGPWEVVDGSVNPDPWGMPYKDGAVGGGTTPTPPSNPTPPAPTLARVVISPKTANAATGATVQFSVSGKMSDGSAQSVTVSYTATGGSISQSGLYTAGNTAGTYRVIATEPSSGLADTASVTINAPAPTLTRVVISPQTASVNTGGTVQFSVSGRMSDGSSRNVGANYTATGGSIGQSGLYTAGSAAGTYRVIATEPSSGLADTASVTITAPPPPPPPPSTPAPPPPSGSYTALMGDDWRAYSSAADLKRQDYFQESELKYVSVVSDGTFGKVVRTTQPAGSTVTPTLRVELPAATGKVWFRWRMRYSPGWTDGGSPSTGARTFDVMGLSWSGFSGRGGISLVGGAYQLNFGVIDRNQYVRYSEALTPGSPSNFGRVGTEWSDGEWYEFVMYYDKNGATSARQHWWRRRLTSGGRPAPGPWTYVGLVTTGAATPMVKSIVLGGDKNKVTPATQSIDWGPWEVVDGSRYANPWGMNVP